MHIAAYERKLRAPISTEVHDGHVCCWLAIELSPADEVLVAHGMHDAVHEARQTFHATLSPALRAIVERATGRTVIEHATNTDLRAHMTLETFFFAPAAQPVTVPPISLDSFGEPEMTAAPRCHQGHRRAPRTTATGLRVRDLPLTLDMLMA